MIFAVFPLIALLFISCDNPAEPDRGGAVSPVSVSSYESKRGPFLSFAGSIPDYYQRSDRFGGFPNGGSAYCGPAAASNALLWLQRTRYPKLVETSGNAVKDQYELIKLLGSEEYFNTDKDGTNPWQICVGLEKFFSGRGIKNVKIEHHGWRFVDSRFKTGSAVPDLNVITERLGSGDAVLLNYGWYKYDAEKDEYTRTSGHWVTLAGFGHDGAKVNPSALIINDPDMRVKSTNYIVTKRIESGSLKSGLSGMPDKAQGFHRFKSSSMRIGIIDGAVIIRN
ncbi:MAG: C39 family peptidase [Chitinispirillales bacterium]|nr:C39 family peptidase [Chitinispirillales bacterium]